MDRDRLDNTIEAFKRQMPFHPFTIVMTNGNRFEADHHNAVICRNGHGVFMSPGAIPIFFDHDTVSEIVGDLANSKPNLA